MMSLWDALRMNMMISYQELVRTFPNDFENLVLIENEPYHKVFTNMQSRIAKGILVGESKITPWAIPSGSIYPPMKNIMDHTK
ncbi:type VI secretion system effector%2C Hcp1 family [Escherichia coli]|nr:type VI secretion system effector%2C Hcp1 family [Escherichia coli]CTW40469.1 type VI secretion system effector%2C Hcp1 family [Escherichia coli]